MIKPAVYRQSFGRKLASVFTQCSGVCVCVLPISWCYGSVGIHQADCMYLAFLAEAISKTGTLTPLDYSVSPGWPWSMNVYRDVAVIVRNSPLTFHIN